MLQSAKQKAIGEKIETPIHFIFTINSINRFLWLYRM